MHDFGLQEREGVHNMFTPLGDDGEKPQEATDIPSEGVRCNGGGEIVHAGVHDPPSEGDV